LQTYTIDDAALLRRYFAGEVSWDVARDHVTVEYTGPTPPEMQKGMDVLPRRDEEEKPATQSASEEGGNVLEIRQQDSSLSKFIIAPFNCGLFRGPSGAASYDTFALFGYTQHLGDGLFFEGAARLKLLENVSDVTQPSPSVLPHVRTDINLYRQEGDAAS
jgi:hypothetical protein